MSHEDLVTDLAGPVARALAHWGDPDWQEKIVDNAAVLYEELAGAEMSAADRRMLSSVLGKTGDPAETPGDSDLRLAEWVATFVENAAAHSKGEDGDTKTWVTRHDDAVRHSHADLDGKTIPIAEKFDLGGARLLYPGQPVGDPAFWINCRCHLRLTKGATMALLAADREPMDLTTALPLDGAVELDVIVGDTLGTLSLGAGRYRFTVENGVLGDFAPVRPSQDPENAPPAPEVDPADMPAENPDEPKLDDETIVPFHGVATVTDRPTGDQRQLASAGFSVRPMPLPVFYQRAQSEGHAGSTIVGQFTRMALNEAGEVEYDGFFNFTPEASEVIQGVAEGWLRGVSVDLDNVIVDVAASTPPIHDGMSEVEAADLAQTHPTVFKQWRVAGLTVVGIPAFYEGFIALGPRGTDRPLDSTDDQSAAVVASLRAEFAPGTHDGPGWLTHPVPTGRIRRYWTHGEGAAKIRWGVPGDFNRCRRELGKYIANPEWLAGACANMHKEAIGIWPGQEDGKHAEKTRALVAAGAQMAAAFNLVAAAPERQLPPVSWFNDPKLSGPTPITIEGDRIFGHIATWGTCHIGLPGVCTTAPTSASNYAWFRLGAIETDAGLVPVGQITMDTGHADLRASNRPAAAHYDNTGTAVADVAAGEDAYGIWFAGRLRPGLAQEKRDALLAAKLSGDWRQVGTSLELVAALAVNTPGFGIPRTGLAASGQQQTALVAAGIVAEPEVELSLAEQIAAGVRAELNRRDRIRTFDTSRLRALSTERRAARVAAVRERFGR